MDLLTLRKAVNAAYAAYERAQYEVYVAKRELATAKVKAGETVRAFEARYAEYERAQARYREAEHAEGRARGAETHQ